jgi:hypothetical protein
MFQRTRTDGLLRFARNDGGEFTAGQEIPRGGQLGETLRCAPAIAACATFDDTAPLAIHLYSYDNAKFYFRNIVTSGSKSYLMKSMGAFYKFFK